MSGRYERKKPANKGGKVALIVLIVVLALVVTAFGGVYIYYNSMLNKIGRAEVVDKSPSDDDLAGLIAPVEETEETEAATEPTVETTEETVPETTRAMTADDIVNILVIGQAARPGEESRMADSTMLITINKYTKVMTLSSVLRDSFVKFPTFKGPDGRTHSGGRVKFTSTYASGYVIGDVGCAMQVADLVMQENFGVEVDHNVEVNFELFTAFVDAIRGVELELTEAEVKYLNKKLVKCGYGEMEPGWNSLDGFGALEFARMRKADGDGDSDIKRTARQRYLVERIVDKVKYTIEHKGLGKIQEIVDSILPYVITDMENSEITSLLTEMIPLLSELSIESGTIPVAGTAWGDYVDIYKDGFQHSVMRFDEGQNKKILRALTEGEITE